MIQEFSVENFLSFGERQTISFEAAISDKKYIDELTVEVKSGVRLLKMAMIYGSNASGKTNLLYAIQTLWEMLFSSQPTKDFPISDYKPFALSEGLPTIFDVVFYVAKIRYDYHIEYDSDKIIFESMYYYPKGTRALFYERKGNSIEFGKTLDLNKKTEDHLRFNTLNNHTVLSTFGKTEIDKVGTKIETLYDWIKCNVHEIEIYSKVVDIIDEAEKNAKLKDFILKTLDVADFNINNFEIVERPIKLPKAVVDNIIQDTSIPEATKEKFLSQKNRDFEFIHSTINQDFRLDKNMESKGTLYSFPLIRRLYDLINKDCVYMVDEIGESLHLDLILHYLLLFIRNSNSNSQLIFTTHNQLLLMQDFIRRDMVWITEKSHETAETELIPVSSYSLHPNVSLFNSYNIGRLGGKPMIGSTLFENED